MKIQMRDLIRATQGQLVSGFPTTAYRRVSIDTRTLKPGDLFFALRGPRFDGHAFLRRAVDAHAAALVVDRLDSSLDLGQANCELIQVPDTLHALQRLAADIRQRAKDTVFIGLTGSNGKTTTKEMLAGILSRAGRTLSTRGNLNNHIGMPLMLLELEPEHQFALLELGTSKPGDMDELLQVLQPQIALMTNVGKDHIEFFGSVEGVFKENRKLFDALPKGGTAVINLDDPLIRTCAGTLSCRQVTYGSESSADVSLSNIQSGSDHIRFTLRIGGQAVVVAMKTMGALQAQNAMAAAACAFALGLSTDDIVKGLEGFRPKAMRMEVRVLPDQTILVEDAYNANPSSMRASLESFAQSYPSKPRWAVLADMRELGPTARQEHRDIGQWMAKQPFERVFLYGRDSRFIAEGLKTAAFRGSVERFRKKHYLIEALKKALEKNPKPAILFKASRRMKLEQVSHALSSLST